MRDKGTDRQISSEAAALFDVLRDIRDELRYRPTRPQNLPLVVAVLRAIRAAGAVSHTRRTRLRERSALRAPARRCEVA